MKKKLVGLLVSMLLIATVSSVAVTANINENNYEGTPIGSNEVYWWPMFHRDPQNSGVSPGPAPETDIGAGSFDINELQGNSPVVVDGRIFMLARSAGPELMICCLDAYTLAEIWSNTSYGYNAYGTPAVADGKVYFGNGKLYCYDASNGDLLWLTSSDYGFEMATTVVDGKVFIGSSASSKMYCFNADNGSIVWMQPIDDTVGEFGAPAVANGKVYIGTEAGKTVYCLNASDGTINWSVTIPGTVAWDLIFATPAVVDGYLYIPTWWDGEVYCLNATNGNIEWQQTTGSSSYITPAVNNDLVYTGADDGLYCLYANNGTIKWHFPDVNAQCGSPAIADGKIYFGEYHSTSGHVYCLDANDGTELWNYTTNHGVLSSPAIADNRVYIGVENEGLYIFGESQYAPDTPNQPEGPTDGFTGFEYTYSVDPVGNDLDGDPPFYLFDWGDGNTSEWLLDPTASYSWMTDGTFEVKVQTRDVYYTLSGWSEPLTVTITNNAPETPQLEGPHSGKPREYISFNISSTDEDGHQIQYGIDWGDGGDIEWTGLYESGETAEVSNKWNNQGKYEVKVIARDAFNGTSDWSESFKVTIIDLFLKEVNGGFGVTAVMKNVGASDVPEVDWSIKFDGGLILWPPEGMKPGTIDMLANEEVTVRAIPLGLGRVTVTVTVIDKDLASMDGFVFGPFVLI